MTTAAASVAKRGLGLFRSWTLRRRLVLAVVALVAILGVAIGLVSVLFLQDNLLGRLDRQVARATEVGVHQTEREAAHGATGPGGAVGVLGQTLGTFAAKIVNGAIVGKPVVVYPGATQTASVDLPDRLIALPVGGTATTVDLGGTLGEYRLKAVSLRDGSELVIGLPMAEVNSTTSQLVFVILIVTLVAIVLAGGIGLLIVRLALRPLDRVAATAAQVEELPLDRGEVALAVRVPKRDTDQRTEVGRVGAAINRMLGHVSSALTARQASELKVRQFVADASHELRTPLASIRGYAELTRRGPHDLPADVVRSIGRIESEAERMTALVEDLLLLARLDEGRALRREPVDLSRLLIDAVSDAHAAGPGHRWTIDLPGEPVVVTGDEPRLYQVVANLLANARVHTSPGTAVMVALSEEEMQDDRVAVVTVTDDGPGIPAELQATLFERFARGDSSRSRETGSTGLGLAIVHAVVEAHAGSVTASSEPGRTEFRVALPAAAALSAVAELPAPPDAGLAREAGHPGSKT